MTRWPSSLRVSAQDHTLARLAALGIVIALLESAIPSPLPGVKPGLANLVTLIALQQLGWRAACWVSLLRIIGSGLLLGSLFSPGFWLSLSGGLVSLLSLALASRLPARFFGVLSHSLLAAMGHLAGQLLLARLWLMPHDGVWLLLPPLMLSSLLGGVATGLLTVNLLQRLASCPHPTPSLLP